MFLFTKKAIFLQKIVKFFFGVFQKRCNRFSYHHLLYILHIKIIIVFHFTFGNNVKIYKINVIIIKAISIMAQIIFSKFKSACQGTFPKELHKPHISLQEVQSLTGEKGLLPTLNLSSCRQCELIALLQR